MPNGEIYQLADELRAIASEGLRFCENGYDRERYGRVIQVTARLLAMVEPDSPEVIQTRLLDNLYHLSPLLATEVVVLREGKLLLVQLRENGLWALPGGICEVGETLAGSAARELWEEAGVHGRITRLLAVCDSRLWQSPSKTHLLSVIFLAEGFDGPEVHQEPDGRIGPLAETLQVGFFGEDELPPLSPGHHVRIPLVFKLLRGEIPVPYFDNENYE